MKEYELIIGTTAYLVEADPIYRQSVSFYEIMPLNPEECLDTEVFEDKVDICEDVNILSIYSCHISEPEYMEAKIDDENTLREIKRNCIILEAL